MRQIFVDSRDRVSGTTTDFVIQLPQTLNLEGGRHRGRVDNLRIPVVVPTIQAGVNDTLQVLIGATTYTVTLPHSNYDGPGLAAALASRLLSTAPGSWTVVYDTGNIAMSISCTNPFHDRWRNVRCAAPFAPLHANCHFLRLHLRQRTGHRRDAPQFAGFCDDGYRRPTGVARRVAGGECDHAVWQRFRD